MVYGKGSPAPPGSSMRWKPAPAVAGGVGAAGEVAASGGTAAGASAGWTARAARAAKLARAVRALFDVMGMAPREARWCAGVLPIAMDSSGGIEGEAWHKIHR